MIRNLLAGDLARLVAVGDGGLSHARRSPGGFRRHRGRAPRRAAGRRARHLRQSLPLRRGASRRWRAGRAVLLHRMGSPPRIGRSPRAQVAAFLHDRPGAPEGEDATTLLAGPAAERLVDEVPAGALVATLATSGSTGDRVLLPKTAGQLLGEARASCAQLGSRRARACSRPCRRTTSTGCSSPCSLPLRAGAAFVRETRCTPKRCSPRSSGTGRRTSSPSLPTSARSIARADDDVARAGVSSGAPLPPDTARAVAGVLGIPVSEVYGSTETGGIAWREDPASAVDARSRRRRRGRRRGPAAPRVAAARPRRRAPLPAPTSCALDPGGGFDPARPRRRGREGGREARRACEVEERALAVPGVRDAAALAEPVGGARGVEVWLAVAAAAEVRRTRCAASSPDGSIQ